MRQVRWFLREMALWALVWMGIISCMCAVGLALLCTASRFQEPGTINLPRIALWIPSQVTGYSISYHPNTGLFIEGDNTPFGYQLMSPPKIVIPYRPYRFRLPIQLHDGRIGVGVLNGRGDKWLLAPITLSDEYMFDTGLNFRVIFVIANNHPTSYDISPSRFTILEE